MNLGTDKCFKDVFDNVNIMVAAISTKYTLITANQLMLDFAKVRLEDIKDMVYWELPWWNHSFELQNMVNFAMENAFFGETSRFEATHIDCKGNLCEIDFIVKPIIENGEVKYLLAMGYNVTDLVHTRKALTKREKQITAFFDHSNEGYFFFMLLSPIKINSINKSSIIDIVTSQQVTGFNNKLSEIVGEKNIDYLNLFELIGIEEDRIVDLWAEMLEVGYVNVKTKIYNGINNNEKYLNITLVGIFSEDGRFEGNFGIVRDNTLEELHVKEISFFANKDPLTGLNNRRSFYKNANTVFEQIIHSSTEGFIAMIDIDYFKVVNDTYGHDIGDMVLKAVAKRIEEIQTPKCVSARFGGEEFVILLPMNEHEARYRMDELCKNVEKTITCCGEKMIKITISIGMSRIEDNCRNIDAAISQADKALYDSKDTGKNKITMFTDELHGETALDPLTRAFTEKAILYKLNYLVKEGERNNEIFSIIYCELKPISDYGRQEIDRYISTLALAISRGIRRLDSLGKYGELGFMALMPGASRNQLKILAENIRSNITIGFNYIIDKDYEIEFKAIEFRVGNKTMQEIQFEMKNDCERIRFDEYI
ncbi:MAG: diguanylate cyclase [Clostridium lundense]|nr:diguanylate cyclase [Clostridium lundense]